MSFIGGDFNTFWSKQIPLFESDPVEVDTVTDAVTLSGLDWFEVRGEP